MVSLTPEKLSRLVWSVLTHMAFRPGLVLLPYRWLWIVSPFYRESIVIWPLRSFKSGRNAARFLGWGGNSGISRIASEGWCRILGVLFALWKSTDLCRSV